MIKTCIICGAEFKASPSSKKVTCSPACRSIRAAQAAKVSGKPWSPEAKARRRENPGVQRQMAQMQAVGVAAALALPEGQRGPQHRSSKVWILIDPCGNQIEVKNLLDWARRNYRRFEPDSIDPDATANRIRNGFGAIASSMRGNPSRARPATTYKGWGLAALPTKEDKHD